MSSPQGRPIGQQYSGSSPDIRSVAVGALHSTRNVSARRSKHKLYVAVASFVFLCCAINIIRFHSYAASEERTLLGWISNDKINHAYDGIIADIGHQNEDSDAPTPSTTSTSSWPTTVPTVLSASKDHKHDMHNADKRVNNANKVQNTDKSANNIDKKSINAEVYPIRIACLDGWEYSQVISCNFTTIQLIPKIKKNEWFPSIPLAVPEYKGSEKPPDGESGENEYVETDTCKYSNSQATSVAPPTCNDIHSLGFDGSDIFQRKRDELYPRMSIKYIIMGGAKCVWKVDSANNTKSMKETFIFKSHKNSWFFKQRFYEQSQRDALISGDRGNMQLESMIESGQNTLPPNWNHILPIYHYCHLASIVPFADGGNLEEWINKYDTDDSGKRPDPIDTLRIALQAARGLYQSQMYMNGKEASFVHADLNPSQFLVFTPNSKDDGKEKLPIIQINDFNQGRFLTRSIHTNETCPFRSCSKNARGNRYHSPERFQGCVDQDEGIDSFSLGSVFFYLLTNGFHPHYESRNYYKPIKEAQPLHIPKRLDLDHPAYDALMDVMKKCMTLELKDRPTSLEVVHMLEEKMKQIGAAED